MSVDGSATPGGSGIDGSSAPESYVWPLAALVVVILPQVLVPGRLRIGPPHVVPIIEGVVLLALLGIAARPGPVPRGARPFILTLFGVLIIANLIAAARLVTLVLRGTPKGVVAPSVDRLLAAASIALSTNIITYGLVYWQIDSGGPDGRALASPPPPDFQFPQTGTEGLAPKGWRPRFPDYIYIAYTNVVAFSPTDTSPLTLRTKGLMMLQSIIALSVLAVVLSRLINILPP